MTRKAVAPTQDDLAALRPADRLRQMFERMVVAKNADLLEVYYHPDFAMTSNGIEQRFHEYAAGHRDVYATAIRYAIRYDEDSWMESADRVAVRLWITTERPDEAATELEVILIATYLEGRLHRLWELTWPDWSRLDAFTEYPGVHRPS